MGTLGRYLNALCYVGSGIALLALGSGAAMVLVGLAMTGYGLYVAFTRRSYWVSTATYILPIFGIAWVAAR